MRAVVGGPIALGISEAQTLPILRALSRSTGGRSVSHRVARRCAAGGGPVPGPAAAQGRRGVGPQFLPLRLFSEKKFLFELAET